MLLKIIDEHKIDITNFIYSSDHDAADLLFDELHGLLCNALNVDDVSINITVAEL